jgi:ferric-dicitrate binding protein FerR (iron transport regulator)
MNHNEHPNDAAMTLELREALSKVPAPRRPPLAAIASRGRVHQRRRVTSFAGLGGAGIAAGIALAVGLTGVLSPAPARSTGTTAPILSTGTIRTAAFTLTDNANGTVTLT